MKKLLAFSLCAGLLGACVAPAMAESGFGNGPEKKASVQHSQKAKNNKRKTQHSHPKKSPRGKSVGRKAKGNPAPGK